MSFLRTIQGLRLAIIVFIMAFISVMQQAKATHLRAGEIIVERVNCQALTFRITIIAYTDCEPANPVLLGGSELFFGDGTSEVVPPDISNTARPDLGDGVCIATYTTEHTYGSSGVYIIGYGEPFRNGEVINIDSPLSTNFYVETEINIDPFLGCNNSPVLLIPPIDRACPGVAFYHNPGAYDPDGDSISFELVVPKKEVGTVVDGYEPINDAIFYENPGQGNENLDGPPTFDIDPISGEITWDAPGQVGEYNIAFIVKEWRKVGDTYRELGFVTRDMQIIVEDCDNERPELEIPEDICVEAGTLIDETIFGTDPDNDDVKIEAFSQVFDFGATVDPDDGEYYPSVPAAELQFSWQTECADIREQPYQVVFKITDNPDEGPRLVSFETWNITVIGPKPEINDLSQDGQGLLLSWDNYFCQNAQKIQVWRRVDSNPFDPDDCETGMRENSGYSLINELPVTATSYKDNDLAAAAKYCYRLVAVFPDPEGGESIVSDEWCFEFVPAKEPVITHVSVEQTEETDGEIIVAWRAPLDSGTLVPPFTYQVQRSIGTGGGSFTTVDEFTVPDLDPEIDSIGYRDSNLNTLDNIYSYKIVLLDPDSDDDLVSATASSVRLEPTPQAGQIRLDWSAVVPWSNVIATPPGSEHLIYRGLEGTAEEDLQFLASVDVTQFGQSFIDSVNIDDDQVYCYKILTKGTYGNPAIIFPQFNFSQMVCAQASDSIPPCQPVVEVEGPDCESLLNQLCNSSSTVFNNTISWSTDFIDQCQDDVREYEIYFASQMGEPYELIATTRDTFYIDRKDNSFKGCYRVKAIDRSGNESELSEEFCVDTCPYYELPNLLTPNGDGCNDTFRAFGAEQGNCPQAEGGGIAPDNSKCARFVESVDFTVYNRWGKPVYTYFGRQGSEGQSIYINWDGRDSMGNELSSGVYYYLAEVTFDVVNPAEAKKDIKGWVHVVH